MAKYVFSDQKYFCEMDVQIGDFRITGDKVEKRIESNKLRLVYNRRPCADLTDVACQGK